MVVIFLPTASLSAVWQERTASPLIWTVQAPHRPAPQPNLVPVICSCSRMTQSSGVSLAASTDILCPLILRLGIFASPPVVDAAYGGNSLVGNAWHPPGRCQLRAEWYRSAMEAIQIRNSRREYGLDFCCALRKERDAMMTVDVPRRRRHAKAFGFHIGRRIA